MQRFHSKCPLTYHLAFPRDGSNTSGNIAVDSLLGWDALHEPSNKHTYDDCPVVHRALQYEYNVARSYISDEDAVAHQARSVVRRMVSVLERERPAGGLS